MAESNDNEGVTYLPSGMIRLVIDGTEVMLRRPKIGELRDLREAAQDGIDRITAESHAIQAESQVLADRYERATAGREDELAAATDPDERADIIRRHAKEDAEYRDARRQLGRPFDAKIEDVRIGWVRSAVGTLAIRGALPEELGDIPSWVVDDDLPASCINHWRTVPSGSGG